MILLFVLNLCFSTYTFAETVVLQSGKTAENLDDQGLSTEGSTEKSTVDEGCFEKVRQLGIEGSHFVQRANFAQAISSFKSSLEVCKKCFSLDNLHENDRKRAAALMLPLYLGWGGSYAALKDYAKAITIFQEGANKIPEFAWTFNDSIASLYTGQKEYQKAIDICKTTLQLFPDSDTTYYALGNIYALLGNYEEAEKNWGNALTISQRKGDTELTKNIEVLLRGLRLLKVKSNSSSVPK